MAKNSFTDKDLGYSKLYTQFAVKEGESTVFVGFLRSSGEYRPKAGKKGKPVTVAQIAAIHEFGSKDGTIPERSFMRSAIDVNAAQIKKLAEQLSARVVDGRLETRAALGVLGEFVASRMKQRITDGLKPDLKRATVRAKGGKTKPLIDTGQLINSIDWLVTQGKKAFGGSK